MQIEFLETGSRDCPLIRLYEVEPKYFSSLHDEILQLATDTRKSCPVHKIPGFQARSDCRLTMFSSSKDEGVQRVGQRLDFEWRLRPAQWFIVAGLVEPFGADFFEGAYQWLSGKEAQYGLNLADISVLLSGSADGRW